MKAAVHQWLRAQPKTFFSDGIKKLVGRWEKCIAKQGDYIEKRYNLLLKFLINRVKKECRNSLKNPSKCYLCRKRFLVKRDHISLKFLGTFADNNSRLMLWSLSPSEFDFEFEHVPGSKIRHADALSRHVGLVEETQLMNKELMIREQKKESFSKEQVLNRLTANGEFFFTWMGLCIGV